MSRQWHRPGYEPVGSVLPGAEMFHCHIRRNREGDPVEGLGLPPVVDNTGPALSRKAGFFDRIIAESPPGQWVGFLSEVRRMITRFCSRPLTLAGRIRDKDRTGSGED